jgi:hypothetical protein
MNPFISLNNGKSHTLQGVEEAGTTNIEGQRI